MSRGTDSQRVPALRRTIWHRITVGLCLFVPLAGVALGQELDFTPRSVHPEEEHELGTRSFVLGGESQYFITLPNAPNLTLSLGGWQGELVLAAGTPDAQGIAAVSGGGTIFADIFEGANGRNCRRVESCTGVLYCDGGHNVDVSQTLDSEGCQLQAGGSGNLPIVVEGAGESDSGAGSLLLHCQVSETTPIAGETLDCDSLADEDYGAPEEFIFTTGTHTTAVANTCENTGPFEPMSQIGEVFDCEDWGTPGSGGILVYTGVNEEPAAPTAGNEDSILPFDVGESSLFQDVAAAVCGNEVTEAGEECEGDGECSEGFYCSDSCACAPDPVCGNGEVETGEDCDAGGQTASCDEDCSLPVCGDGLLNLAAGETCEGDDACATDEICGAACGCTAGNTCGNGRVEPGEICDDGNLVAGDGCDTACAPELPFAIKLVNFNLLHQVFSDNDIEDRLALTADALATSAPDIVTLQEVTVVDGTSSSQWLINRLADHHDLDYFGVGFGNPAAGQAVLSRWPVELFEVEELPTEASAPSFPDRRFFGRVQVASPLGLIDVYALHFCAGSQGCDHEYRSTQTEAVLAFIEATHASLYPYLVGADFNAHRGTDEDANPENDPPIDIWLEAGHIALFDGGDAPCNSPSDSSGCTSSQELRADSDTTTRRIDNIMTAPEANGYAWREIGPTQAFAASASTDPNPECTYDSPTSCSLTSDCTEAGSVCNQQSGACEPEFPACTSDDDCPAAATCGDTLWASDHHGVETQIELTISIPEPTAATSSLAMWLTLSLLAAGPARRARHGATR